VRETQRLQILHQLMSQFAIVEKAAIGRPAPPRA